MHHSRPDGSPYPKEECPLLSTLQDGLVVHVADDVYWHRDGSSFPVEYISSPMRNAQQHVIGAVVTFQDITQRKEINRMKDELISTVSHELRTPLTSLRGFTELMLKRNFSVEKQREFLDIMHAESKRLTNLINDFLDIQRIEAGRQPYTFTAVDLAPRIADVLKVFVKAEGPHPIHVEIPARLPAVCADGDRLHQVMENLLSNAIKFSPRGGEVIVGAQAENDEVTVWVTDHGIGIPAEALPKLFNKFYRVDNSETRKIGGAGLGLALIKDIVLAHRGRIWVKSIFGKGSTFFFTLPVAN
jgi:signal transduction histidine kinase